MKNIYLLVIMFLFAVPVHATQAEPGTIDFIDAKTNLIVINDRPFRYLPYVKVHGTKNQRVYAVQSLKVGMVVALKFGVLPEEEGRIVEIYLLD